MDVAVERAVAEARKSAETFRHGAVLFDGRTVLAVGRNRNLNAFGLSSIHAEMDAIWKVSKSRPSKKQHHIVVVRLRRDQEYGCSRPCAACARALTRWGISTVTYSTDDPLQPFVTKQWPLS